MSITKISSIKFVGRDELTRKLGKNDIPPGIEIPIKYLSVEGRALRLLIVITW